MSKQRPEIFISATSADLGQARQIVKDAILSLGFHPVEQSHFPPDYREIREVLVDSLSKCDAMIHLVGKVYGTEPATRPEGSERRSYTQIEYDVARELGIPIYTFVAAEEYPYADFEPEDKEKQRLQKAHRDSFTPNQHAVAWVNAPLELQTCSKKLGDQLESLEASVSREARRTQKSRARLTAIAILRVLMIVAAGIWIIRGMIVLNSESEKMRESQLVFSELAERESEAPRVMAAYQDRFREIRDDPSREESLPNQVIDEMVRKDLPEILGLQEEFVLAILDVVAPRLARLATTPVEVKLQALFVMGAYEQTLEVGKSGLVNPSILSLQVAGDAARMQFEQNPARRLLDDAIRYHTSSQVLIKREENPELWATASAKLASVLRDSGEYERVETLFHDIVETRVETLGSEHPETLVAMADWAAWLHLAGDSKQAEFVLKDLIPLQEGVVGADNEDTLKSKHCRGVVMGHLGNHGAAQSILHEVLRVRERVLGLDHPETLKSMRELGVVLMRQNKEEEAEATFREVLERRKKILPEGHPDLLLSMEDWAAILQGRGETNDAENLLRQVLRSRIEVLGEDHPATRSLDWLVPLL